MQRRDNRGAVSALADGQGAGGLPEHGGHPHGADESAAGDGHAGRGAAGDVL